MGLNHNLFARPSGSFDLHPRALEWILADPANPLNRLTQAIPKGASVLDVGAGNGMLARLLLHVHGDLVIDGVEPDEAAIQHAKPWYRHLFHGSVENFLCQVSGDLDYDYVVFADVIEHVSDPQRVLETVRSRLGRSTRVCVSTPNVAFASVRVALLNGVFDYVDSGILERSHLRFFTLRSLTELFGAADLYPEETLLLKRNPLDMEIRLADLKISPLLLHRLLRDELATVYQFLFILRTENCTSALSVYGDPGKRIALKYLGLRLTKGLRWLDKS